MNKAKLNNLWEASRDGSISESDLAALEAHLRENESAAAMWQAESQWLALMADVDGELTDSAMADEPDAVSGESFAMSTVEAWQAQQEREALGVVAKIGPSSASGSLRRYASLAAMIVLFIGAAVYVSILTSQFGTNKDGEIVIAPSVKNNTNGNAAQETAPEAIGLLLTSAKESYAVAAAQPARWRQGFADTAAMFDVANLADLLDPGVPDPATYILPSNGG